MIDSPRDISPSLIEALRLQLHNALSVSFLVRPNAPCFGLPVDISATGHDRDMIAWIAGVLMQSVQSWPGTAAHYAVSFGRQLLSRVLAAWLCRLAEAVSDIWIHTLYLLKSFCGCMGAYVCLLIRQHSVSHHQSLQVYEVGALCAVLSKELMKQQLIYQIEHLYDCQNMLQYSRFMTYAVWCWYNHFCWGGSQWFTPWNRMTWFSGMTKCGSILECYWGMFMRHGWGIKSLKIP
jgi:hypothetical protein